MKILVVDIETTGFYTKTDAILEIGIALVDTKIGKIELVFNKIVRDDNFNPVKHKDCWAFKNTTIKMVDVLKAKPLDFYKEEIQELFDKYKMTAYNKVFDLRFLNQKGFKCSDIKCLMKSATEYSELKDKKGGVKKPTVEEIYRQFFPNTETEYVEEHRAGQDALDEAKILLHMVVLKQNTMVLSEDLIKTKLKKPQSNHPRHKPMGPDDIMTFGLHKGKTFTEVIKHNSSYIRWCLKEVKTFKLTTAAKNMLAELNKDNKDGKK